MEEGDQMQVETTRREFGVEESYIITQPDGKWYKHGIFKRDNSGPPSEAEARWRIKDNTKKFLMWIVKGLDPVDFNKNLGTDFKESDIREILSKEEIQECVEEMKQSEIKYSK